MESWGKHKDKIELERTEFEMSLGRFGGFWNLENFDGKYLKRIKF
jgi:hypothetical protein